MSDMDYTQLFDRWVALTVLSEGDRKALVERMHEEVTSGVQALGALAAGEVSKFLEEAKYDKREDYLKSIVPILALAAFDGYLLFLMERGINPQTEDLRTRDTTKGLGDRWSRGYEKDQNGPYLKKTDPIIGLLLNKIYELRVNQVLSFHPEIVELPYRVTEKLHQYIGWCVHQGYILGLMEQELASQGVPLRS